MLQEGAGRRAFAEGVIAEKRSVHYLAGRRGWIKPKNRAYWRYPLEVEAALGTGAKRSAEIMSLAKE
jgi:hypothetical protein